MAPSAQYPLNEMAKGHFGGSQYVANPLPFFTGLYGQPQAATFQNMPANHGHYDGFNLGAQQHSYYPLNEMAKGHFGGSQYVANPLPFFTGLYGQPQAATFQNMP